MSKSNDLENKEPEEINEINVFVGDDEYLKILGELLSNETSRKIIKILTEDEMYKQQIAEKLGVGVSAVIHHLNKMEKINLVQVNKKKLIRKGIDHSFYKLSPTIIIPLNDKAKESSFFKKLVNKYVKFAVIGVAAFSSWVIQNWMPRSDIRAATDVESNVLIIPLVVIIVGLVIERILFRKK